MDATNSQRASPPAPASETGAAPSVIKIHIWPKTLVFYPAALCAVICAVVGYFFGAYPAERELARIAGERAEQLKAVAEAAGAPAEQITALAERLARGQQVDKALGWVFFLVLAVALFALCIDTEIRWALIWFLGSLAVILLLMLLNYHFRFLPEFIGRVLAFDPAAKPQFYAGIAAVWLLLFVISLFIAHFHYVKIERNEVFVTHGLLEGQRRYPTLQMKYEKDVADVLEYYLPLVRAGKLILSFPNGERVVLDNVRNIDRVIRDLNALTSELQVGVR